MERITIADFNSAGIREYARIAGATTMKQETDFGKGDQRITFYRLDTGQLVADTSGDPELGEDAERLLDRCADSLDQDQDQNRICPIDRAA